jgi:hypothetical protein
MANTYTLIEAKILSTTPATVTFSVIPQTYTDLLLKVSARSTQTDFAVTDLIVGFNGVSTDRTEKRLRGYTGGAISQSTSNITIGNMPSAVNTSNTFCNAEMYVPNYTSSNSKPVSVDGVSESNTNDTYDWWLNLNAGLWNPSTQAPITSIELSLSSDTFNIYSTFYLYGIKNS